MKRSYSFTRSIFSELSLAAGAMAALLFAGTILRAQSTGTEPALQFDAPGDEIAIDGGMTVAAGADVEFTAWIYPISWEGNNPGLWRSGATAGGNCFNIFQGKTGRPWIRWNGTNILRPSDGYSVPLGQWTQVKYVVKSQASAEFWTRSPGAEWILRHSATHSVQTPEFQIFRYGWQAGTGERVRGLHNDLQFFQNGALFCHWALNEGSGSVATDSSGNGNDGTINGPEWVDTTGRPSVMPTSLMPFDHRFGSVRFLRVIGDHTGAQHQIGMAAAEAQPFVDDPQTITSLPAELQNKVMIRTANAQAQWLIEREEPVVWTFVDSIPDIDLDGNSLPNANTTLADGSGLFQPVGDGARATSWTYRSFGNDRILHSLGPTTTTTPDTPELVTTVTGLAPDSKHPVYALFWSDSGGWGVRAGLNYGNDKRDNPWFDRNSDEVVLASELGIWETDPLFVESNRRLYAAYLGVATATSAGEVDVFIHDLPSAAAGTRTWHDGVAVGSRVPLGSGNYLAFEVDRDTALYIANESSSEPEWLTSHFSKTSMTIETTGGVFDVWQRTVAARETVMLPGNAGAPGDSNYWVILGEDAEAITGSPDDDFLRTPVLDWGLGNYTWQTASNPEHAFHTASMISEVTNFKPENGFKLSADVRVPRLQNEGANSYGLVLLGDADGFIFAEWLPREPGGGSMIRLVDSATGSVLASAPWEGMTPTRVNNDVGVTDGSEHVFETGTPYFAGETLFFDDFENGAAAGWTSGGDENTWEIGPPQSGPGAAVSGQNVAATGLDEPYRAWTDAWFRSPVIDLTQADAATLRFWEFTDLDADIDYHYTVVSIVDADSGAEIEELSRDAGQSGDWRFRELSLSSASLGQRVFIQFRLKSDNVNLGGAGWFLDDVGVTSEVGLVITEIPEQLDPRRRLLGIRTGIGDLADVSDTYLQFTLADHATNDGNDGATVYVAWDVRNSGVEPDWLRNNFVRTDHVVGVSSDAGHHRLWAREYAAGAQVTLGGASAAGSGPFPPDTDNYFVLLGDSRAGLESAYALSAEGSLAGDTWTLKFTLTDADGFSASVESALADARDGRHDFGVAAQHPDAADEHEVHAPVWQTLALAMDYLAAPEFLRFDAWRQEHFSAAELSDPAISGADASPAGDGVSNLMKYALDLSPWIPIGSTELPKGAIDEGGRLILGYWERTDVDDITYVPEVSEDLVTWTSGAEHVVEVYRSSIGENLEAVEARAVLAPEAGRGFMRLRVHQSTP